jgi:uncharacterized membrane protein YbjE (DUF340 family)
MKIMISGLMTGFVISAITTNINQETKYILIVLLFLIYAVCLIGYDKNSTDDSQSNRTQRPEPPKTGI